MMARGVKVSGNRQYTLDIANMIEGYFVFYEIIHGIMICINS